MWWCDDVTQSNPNLHIIYTHVFPRFSETFDGFCRFFPFCTLNQTTFLLFQFEWHISLSLLLLFLFAVDVFFFINGNNGLVWPMRMYMLWYLWSMVIAQFCPLHVHFKSIFNTIQSRVVRLLDVLYILNVTFVCFIYSHHFRFEFNLGEYHTCVSPLSFNDVR